MARRGNLPRNSHLQVGSRLTSLFLIAALALLSPASQFASQADTTSPSPEATASATATASASASASAVATPSNNSSTNSVTTPEASKVQAPAIAQMPNGGRDDDEGEEHEGRERRGEHRDRFEGHEDGDDD